MKEYTVGVILHVTVKAKDAADAIATAEFPIFELCDRMPRNFPDESSVQSMTHVQTELLS